MVGERVDLTLRPAGAADADALAALFLSARAAAFPAMPRPVHTDEEVRRWFADLVGSDRDTWVAEADGAVLAYLVLDATWLDSLYVRPDLTGRGIGGQLLDLAKALRPAGFGLWVFESNEPARRFYRRHGLVEISRTDGRDNEEHEPDVEMLWPGEDPVAALRSRIDAVDDELALLLDRRAALTALVQRHKPVPGHPGRDREREAEIAERMAGRMAGQITGHTSGHTSGATSGRTVRLGPERVRRIMDVVIGESLDAAAEQPGPDESRT